MNSGFPIHKKFSLRLRERKRGSYLEFGTSRGCLEERPAVAATAAVRARFGTLETLDLEFEKMVIDFFHSDIRIRGFAPLPHLLLGNLGPGFPIRLLIARSRAGFRSRFGSI